MKQLPILKKSTVLRIQRGTAFLATIALLLLSFPVGDAQAAAVTAMKDTLSRAQVSTQGTHAFSFTTATSLTAGETIVLMFNNGTSDWTLDGTIAAADFSAVSGLTIVDACTGAASEVQPTVTNGANDFYTFTVCATDTVAAGAIAFTFDNNEITNPGSQNSYKIDITTTSDSGSLAVAIVTDDSVNVTATVDPSISFTISDVTIGFGTLSTSAVRYANGAATGSGTDVVAHTMAVTTNATSGYVVTYNGATLTSGANTIDVANIDNDADGTISTEQFALSIATNGNATIDPDYTYTGSPDWRFVAGATTQVISETGPTATETFDLHYLANISGLTEAGSYTTDITYIATGTF